MEILAWNCFGLGNYKTSRHLKELKRQRRLKIAFLSETKMKGIVDFVKFGAGFDSGIESEAQGKSGGLMLLWDNDVDLHFCSMSRNHVDVVITMDGVKWRLTGLHGFPEANQKRATFHLLEHLRTTIQNYPILGDFSTLNLPWCVIGDFNCIITNSEKQGGRLYPRDSHEAFSNFMLDSDMYKMGFKGSSFTWSWNSVALLV